MKSPTPRDRAKAEVAAVRALYPYPRKKSTHGLPQLGDYCVLGAYLHYNGTLSRFPAPSVEETPELRGFDDWNLMRITDMNDEGRFEEAWAALEDALAHMYSMREVG